MIHTFKDATLDSVLHLIKNEPDFNGNFISKEADSTLTIAWNVGPDQKITIDDIVYDFPAQSIVPLVASHTFHFSQGSDVIAWQFNKDFYCIIDHDQEVSCVGFIFYGSNDHLFIRLDEANQRKLESLREVFEDEYAETDTTKGEMLRMLLKRLIIIITRLGKQQYLSPELKNEDADIVRSFNLLLEDNFRKFHQVQDYANLLNKSPKTLSHLFSKYNQKSPLQVIKERIVLEAKRLLHYTDKSSKEIAFDLGFDDPASFSRFFKKQMKMTPSAFKKVG